MISFSIVIPVYNGQRTIVRSLESCINQSYLPKEIILVDDKSYDDTQSILQEWIKNYQGDIKVTFESLAKNSGPSTARNRGWHLATSDYICFLDADDYFTLDKLENVVEVIKKEPSIILLGHAHSIIEQKKEDTTGVLRSINVWNLLLKNQFVTPAVTIRRDILERFDINMTYTEDHDLWLRVTENCKKTYFLDKCMTVIDRPVNSSGGQSGNLWKMRLGEIVMYKKYCLIYKKTYFFPLFVSFSLYKHMIKQIRG